MERAPDHRVRARHGRGPRRPHPRQPRHRPRARRPAARDPRLRPGEDAGGGRRRRAAAPSSWPPSTPAAGRRRCRRRNSRARGLALALLLCSAPAPPACRSSARSSCRATASTPSRARRRFFVRTFLAGRGRRAPRGGGRQLPDRLEPLLDRARHALARWWCRTSARSRPSSPPPARAGELTGTGGTRIVTRWQQSPWGWGYRRARPGVWIRAPGARLGLVRALPIPSPTIPTSSSPCAEALLHHYDPVIRCIAATEFAGNFACEIDPSTPSGQCRRFAPRSRPAPVTQGRATHGDVRQRGLGRPARGGARHHPQALAALPHPGRR